MRFACPDHSHAHFPPIFSSVETIERGTGVVAGTPARVKGIQALLRLNSGVCDAGSPLIVQSREWMPAISRKECSSGLRIEGVGGAMRDCSPEMSGDGSQSALAGPSPDEGSHRTYVLTACSMPGPAFIKSSAVIAGWNSTVALSPRKKGSATAGICEGFSRSVTMKPVRFPSISVK